MTKPSLIGKRVQTPAGTAVVLNEEMAYPMRAAAGRKPRPPYMTYFVRMDEGTQGAAYWASSNGCTSFAHWQIRVIRDS